MTTTFGTNSAANSAVSYLQRNSDMQGSSISKLSSGSRIVKASDDAASLAVGTKLEADLAALKQAGTNASQAQSLLQVADGALSRVSDALIRMKALATQASSDVLSDDERGYLDLEFQEMSSQIDFIASSTRFNDTQLINGGFEGSANAAVFQVGTQAGSGGDTIEIEIAGATTGSGDLNVEHAAGSGNFNIETLDRAQTSQATLDTAIETVNEQRATLGAQMARLEKIGENIATSTENLDAARSTLMDVDVAAEMTRFSTNQVKTQAATAMLAQANKLPQNLMQLLQ